MGVRAQETLTAFMEDVISHMAGYVPLKAIAERILAAYANDPFGDFKVINSFTQTLSCRGFIHKCSTATLDSSLAVALLFELSASWPLRE
jgi:hypothetical protein